MIFDKLVLMYHILSHGLEVDGGLGRARLPGDLCSEFPFVNSVTLWDHGGLAMDIWRNTRLSHNLERLGVFFKMISPNARNIRSRDMPNTGLDVPIINN